MTCVIIILAPERVSVLTFARKDQRTDIPIDGTWSAESLAREVSVVLKSHGSTERPTILALDGSFVLSTTLRHHGGRSKQPAALLYQVEEFLPLSAEEIVADFVVFRQEALAVTMELARVEPLVAGLAKLGIQLRSIVPLPLLLLQGANHESFSSTMPLIIWRNDEWLDCVILAGGKPKTWRRIPAEPQSLEREIHWLKHQFPEISNCIGINLGDLANGLNNIEFETQQVLRKAVTSIVSGRSSGVVELKRHPLAEFDPLFAARERLRMLAMSIALLFAALSYALITRIQQNEETANYYRDQQTEVFRKALPGQTMPTGVVTRLESEHRKLSALTGKVQGMPKLDSAVHLLVKTLLPLPADIRIRILEARIDANGVHLDGEVREHGHADLIASALRKLGLDVTPPRTERLPEKGVSFAITGQIASSNTKANK